MYFNRGGLQNQSSRQQSSRTYCPLQNSQSVLKLIPEKVILNRMRDKAHRALSTVHNMPTPPPPDGAARGVKEEMEDDFVVFAGRRRVFRSGGGGSAAPTPQAVPTAHDPTLPHDEHAAHGMAGESMIGEWLARQEPYVGYDPHYMTAIESPPSASHDHQHPQHQHQNRQYGYASEQPQYTLEAVPPPHYMTAPYATYAPPPHPPHRLLHPHAPHPHELHPSSSQAPGMGHPPGGHEMHRDELAEMQREYGVAARAPAPELAQLGFAANGSRMSEQWLSFMQ